MVACVHVHMQCAEDERMRDLVRFGGCLSTLVALISNPTSKPDILMAAAGAIWKLCRTLENVVAFGQHNIIPVLVRLLKGQPEKVYLNLCYVSMS